MQQTDLDRYLVQMQFRGMPAQESNITRAWLRANGLDYDRFEFNVTLGDGRPAAEGIDAATAAQHAFLSKSRADVIGYVGDRVDIVEVKDRAKATAMGQIRGYAVLWRGDHPGIPIRRLLVVARSIDPDVERIFAHEGQEFAIVEPEVMTL